MAKDKYHYTVKRALEKDGWTITHDPLRYKVGARKIEIDLGAEQLIGAEKGTEKIAVEVKSFLGVSEITDFYHALGQYQVYLKAIEYNEPERVLFLAVPSDIFDSLFIDDLPKIVIESYNVHVISFDINSETVVLWKK